MQKIISFFKKHFYGIVGGSLMLAAILFFVPEQAFGFWSITSIVTSIIQLVAYVLNYLIGLLLMLATFLANTMINLNLQILDTEQNRFLAVGWKICRDIANLGFVLALIISALVTIVRSGSSFTVKKNLPKIITAAILVNFSLSIAGVFMNLSDTFTYYFINHSTAGGVSEWATTITGAFGPQRLLLQGDPLPPDPKSQGDATSGFAAATLISISGLVFSVLFTALATLIMGAIALMLLYRYVLLTILLTVVPLAWLFYVFPGIGKSGDIYKNWWSKFIQWTFFAPAMTFFIYLAIISAKALGETNMTGINNSGLSGVLQNVFSQGVQMITLGAFLIGSLFAGQAMGMSTAGAAMKVATGAGGAMKKWAVGKAANAGRRALTVGSNTDAEGRSFAEQGLGKLSSGLRKIPLLGGLAAAGTMAASRGISGQKGKLVEQGEKAAAKFKDVPNAMLLEEVQALEQRKKRSVKEEARLAKLKENLMKRDGISREEKEAAITGLSVEEVKERDEIKKDIKKEVKEKLQNNEEYKAASSKEKENLERAAAEEMYKNNDFLRSIDEKRSSMDKKIINQFKAAGNIDTLLKYRPEFAEELGRGKDAFMMKKVLENAETFIYANTNKLGEILTRGANPDDPKNKGYDKILTSTGILSKVDEMKSLNNAGALRSTIQKGLDTLTKKATGEMIKGSENEINQIKSILGESADITEGFDKFLFQTRETMEMLQKKAGQVRMVDKEAAKKLEEDAETLRLATKKMESQMGTEARRVYDAQKNTYDKLTMFSIDHKEDNKNFMNKAKERTDNKFKEYNTNKKTGSETIEGYSEGGMQDALKNRKG